MIKVNFKPKTDINEYLKDDFHIELFEDLTEGDWKDIFQPLEFFNLLYEQLTIIIKNKDKPISIIEHLFALGLEGEKLYFLLHYLKWFIYKYGDTTDKQLKVCYNLISKRFECLSDKLFPPKEPPKESEINQKPDKTEERNDYNFDDVKQHIEGLNSIEEKIEYLINKRADYKQKRTSYFSKTLEPKFDALCSMEIHRLKEILNLKTQSEEAPGEERIKTIDENLRKNLRKYGFFDLKKVKELSHDNQDKLMEFICNNGTPYKIAMFDYLGFIDCLKKHFRTLKELHKNVSNWLVQDERTIKGNINCLTPHSKEDRERYTAFQYKETVQKDYDRLK